jgi:hypothetical protein
MSALDEHCEIALANVCRAINSSLRFPRNVFDGDWRDFFFFDSDWMSDGPFVGVVKAFLDIEHSRCACVLRLDVDRDDIGPRSFCVRQNTEIDEYQLLLGGSAPGFGWLNAVERIGCASDVGEWCIYAEPNNDIAVIAFRDVDSSHRYSSAMARVHARASRMLLENLRFRTGSPIV